jgi:hypothetical protein
MSCTPKSTLSSPHVSTLLGGPSDLEARVQAFLAHSPPKPLPKPVASSSSQRKPLTYVAPPPPLASQRKRVAKSPSSETPPQPPKRRRGEASPASQVKLTEFPTWTPLVVDSETPSSSRYSWKQPVGEGGKSALDMLVQWLAKDGNYHRWKTGTKRVVQEDVAEWLGSVDFPGISPASIYNQIRSLEDSHRDASEWLEQTLRNDPSHITADGSPSSHVLLKLHRKCHYWGDLEAMMSHQSFKGTHTAADPDLAEECAADAMLQPEGGITSPVSAGPSIHTFSIRPSNSPPPQLPCRDTTLPDRSHEQLNLPPPPIPCDASSQHAPTPPNHSPRLAPMNTGYIAPQPTIPGMPPPPTDGGDSSTLQIEEEREDAKAQPCVQPDANSREPSIEYRRDWIRELEAVPKVLRELLELGFTHTQALEALRLCTPSSR